MRNGWMLRTVLSSGIRFCRGIQLDGSFTTDGQYGRVFSTPDNHILCIVPFDCICMPPYWVCRRRRCEKHTPSYVRDVGAKRCEA